MANPYFSHLFKKEEAYTDVNCATYKGITLKTLLFLVLTVASGIASCVLFWEAEFETLISLLGVSLILSLVSGLFGRWSVNASGLWGTIYSLSNGFLLGLVSLAFEEQVRGIVLVAVLSTIGVFVSMLVLFASGIIRNKGKLVSFFISIGTAVIVISLITLIMSIIPGLSFVFDNIGILLAIEAVFLLFASISLLMDFTEATMYVQNGFDKKYEWYCAFGLLVSIIYIYLRILRILALISKFKKD